jgi:putative SOS response-associated peptidase YedK
MPLRAETRMARFWQAPVAVNVNVGLTGVCGRFTSTSGVERLAELLKVDEVRAEPLPPRYNVAPSNKIYAVALGKDSRRLLGTFRWGLVPSWAKDTSVGNRMINARAEGIASKPASGRL